MGGGGGRGGGEEGSQKGQKSSAESLNVTTYYYHFFSDGFWGSELRAVHPPKQISILLQEKKKTDQECWDFHSRDPKKI